jgi:hypothetical protein
VGTTIIDGQIIMHDRVLLTMDEDAILDMAQEWGTRLRERSLKSELYGAKRDREGDNLL